MEMPAALVVWHFLLLILGVDLHGCNLTLWELWTSSTLQRSPCTWALWGEAAEPCSTQHRHPPLMLWLSGCGTRRHALKAPELTLKWAEGLRSCLNHQQVVLLGAVGALLEVIAGHSVCPGMAAPENSWTQPNAPEPDHMQQCAICTH